MEKELKQYKQYIKELENQIKYLEQQLKVTEQDRDESKSALQGMIVKYLELYAEKNNLNKEDLFKEIGQDVKKIIEG